ncbi:hypothetical protein [Selenomonas noxia]|uniref:hypothetical protein n=1 Tax=Selenomonas noxia TaxID=135083 RepID=UPI0028EB1269|nr:hypothetical protein [Selenomonas noxia]
MNGILGLVAAIRAGIKNSKVVESQAQRGRIQNGRVHIGERSYPFRVVVDCNTSDGSLVWVQISRGGTAVIVGA